MRIIILQQRINYIDNLKAFGIFTVVLGHMASPLSTFIYSFHMPLFFVISGFFIKTHLDIKEFIKRDFKRYMVVYFVFSTIGVLVETLKRFVLHRQALDYLYEFKGIFYYMDFLHLSHTYAFILWFLPTLFFSRLLLILIVSKVKNIFIELLIVCIFFITSFYVDLPFAIDNALNALLFVFVGYVYFNYFKDKNIILILIPTLISLYYLYGIPILNMALKKYQSLFVNIIWALCVIGIIIFLFKNINFKNKIISLWGMETMFIFIIHPYINNITYVVLKKINFNIWYIELFISLFLLQCLLFVKVKFNHKGIFKYV